MRCQSRRSRWWQVCRHFNRARRPDLADRVLDDLGLGDAYVQVDGPIGPLFVAYGPHGISLVTRKGSGEDEVDAGEFEEEFLATFGRPVHRVEKAPDLIEKIIKARVWGDGQGQRTSRCR